MSELLDVFKDWTDDALLDGEASGHVDADTVDVVLKLRHPELHKYDDVLQEIARGESPETGPDDGYLDPNLTELSE